MKKLRSVGHWIATALLAISPICNAQQVWDYANYKLLDYVAGAAGLLDGCTGSRSMRVVSNQVVLTGGNEATGCEIWATDGTIAGTQLLADIRLGPSSSIPRYFTPTESGLLYFTAAPESGLQQRLWRTDGTPGGTFSLGDMEMNLNFGLQSDVLIDMSAIGDTLYFSANDGIHGIRAWMSDGTPASTTMIPELDFVARTFVQMNGFLLFNGVDSSGQLQILRMPIPHGTAQQLTSFPNEAGYYYQSLYAFGDVAYFAGPISSYRRELFRCDGTPEGTGLVKILNDIPNPTKVKGSSPGNFCELGNGVVVFSAATETMGIELWRTDGTEQGTWLVRDINTQPFDLVHGSSAPNDFVSFQGHVYFLAKDSNGDTTLWTTDGTETGTYSFQSTAITGASYAVVNGFLYIGATGLYRISANQQFDTILPSSNGLLGRPIYTHNMFYSVNGFTNTGLEVAFGSCPPWVESIEPETASPSSAQEVMFVVNFSIPVIGIDRTDFQSWGDVLTGPEVISATAIGDGVAWQVTVDTGMGDGTLYLKLVDDGTITDNFSPLVRKPLEGYGIADGSFNGAVGIVIDKADPTIVLSTNAEEPTPYPTIPMTATFDRPMADFTQGDLVVSNAAVSDFSGDGTVYTFTLTAQAQGVVSVQVAAGAAVDNVSLLENVPSNVLVRTFDESVRHASADVDGNGSVSLSELLRVIQFYNSGGYHCAAGTEDGYDPNPGDVACAPHTGDYKAQDWSIGFSELLRAVQFYNAGAYHFCNDADGEGDGFCVGVA